MAKIDRILQLLETRIARGDYAMTLFPTEHGLAEEMSVGRMTARRAILRLIDKGLLRRDNAGRLVVTPERLDNRPMHIGFIAPTLSSAVVMHWQRTAEKSVRSFGGHMRVGTYFHWDDPTLFEATDSFDGVMLVPPAEPLPPQLAGRLLASRARIVILGTDYSSLGLQSVDVFSSRAVSVLLEHLETLGHRQITVLNTQPVVADIQERLDLWQSWVSERNYGGELINEPELSYGDPMKRAYEVAKERLQSGVGMGGTAVLCTTMPAALGLMRAANEHDLVIGRDLSVCVVNDEGMGPFLSPTLTSTRMPDPQPLLTECLVWMAGGEWRGPLLKSSTDVELFVGNSTAPPGTSPEKQKALSLSADVVLSGLNWNEEKAAENNLLAG